MLTTLLSKYIVNLKICKLAKRICIASAKIFQNYVILSDSKESVTIRAV